MSDSYQLLIERSGLMWWWQVFHPVSKYNWALTERRARRAAAKAITKYEPKPPVVTRYEYWTLEDAKRVRSSQL